ncbi:hypothetical protein [Chryseobacterium sp. sg2396]|uniref:hypothetical protein n=1 Tax=Chryseobacterium sp. sg2396 TaxID=3276280 RepID=UPI0025CCDD16|nr:hypothetical protein [uncultured Chryseobacterium sp.]
MADEERESRNNKNLPNDGIKNVIDVYLSKPEIDDLENILEGKPKQKKRFPEIHKANLGDEIFLVARTENLIGKKLKIEIRQAKERQIADKDRPVIFKNQDRSGSITITVGKGTKDKDENGQDYFSKYANANKLENFAWKSFLLRPESDNEFEQWKRTIEDSREKKLYLYFHAEVLDEQDRDTIFINGDKSEGIQNFSNSEGTYFEISDGESTNVLENTNGNFYDYDGLFLSKVTGKKNGLNTDVYVCEEKGDRENTFIGAKKLNTTYSAFINHASTAYGESSVAYNVVDKYEIFAIASVHKRNKVAYGVNSDFAVKFRNLTDVQRSQKIAMKYAIAGEINALLDGTDYSNGAKQWDGAEQTHLPVDKDISSNGRFMFKVNVMGWDITDELYSSWKKVVSNKFGVTYFNVPQRKFAVSNYKGMTNKNKIRLKSVAQYGLTMFWKEVIINKPKN